MTLIHTVWRSPFRQTQRGLDSNSAFIAIAEKNSSNSLWLAMESLSLQHIVLLLSRVLAMTHTSPNITSDWQFTSHLITKSPHINHDWQFTSHLFNKSPHIWLPNHITSLLMNKHITPHPSAEGNPYLKATAETPSCISPPYSESWCWSRHTSHPTPLPP